MTSYHISFAGAGRVGSSLCREFSSAGHTIDLIVSNSRENGMALAESCSAQWAQVPTFPDTTEIIIVAVPDNRLEDVLHKIKCRPSAIVAHTAGSYGLEVFPENIRNRAVFYPLQTFSAGRKIDFSELPVLLETIDNQTFKILDNLAVSIGAKVHPSGAQQRRMLHIAAVFACNFTNHMFTISSELAEKAGLDFEIMKPLISETVAKALENGPGRSQTGPAIRNDRNTIDKHLQLLAADTELQRIYQELTDSIINHYKKN
jgi:predicted short-subunit dehydrogenase-like oxidoreductase (DUF2520 family)